MFMVVESVRKRRKRDVFYYNNAIGYLCKKLQKCHRSFSIQSKTSLSCSLNGSFEYCSLNGSFEHLFSPFNTKGENKCQTNNFGLEPTIFWIQTQKTVTKHAPIVFLEEENRKMEKSLSLGLAKAHYGSLVQKDYWTPPWAKNDYITSERRFHIGTLGNISQNFRVLFPQFQK